MNTEGKKAFLESYGWTVGPRDPRINTDYSGGFMCVEPFSEDQLPTRNGSNGPWALVGDDLGEMIDVSYSFLTEMMA